MVKSLDELNKMIRQGKTVVVDGHEITEIDSEKPKEQPAQQVDAVTSGTQGAALYFAGRLPQSLKKKP